MNLPRVLQVNRQSISVKTGRYWGVFQYAGFVEPERHKNLVPPQINGGAAGAQHVWKTRPGWLESSENEPLLIIEMFDHELEVLEIPTVQLLVAVKEDMTGPSDFVETIKNLVMPIKGIEEGEKQVQPSLFGRNQKKPDMFGKPVSSCGVETGGFRRL